MEFIFPNDKNELFDEASKAITNSTDGVNVDVQCLIHHPWKGSAVIRISGLEVAITCPEIYAEVAKQADNFEIYPKTDGSVNLDLAFHGLK